LAAEPCTTPAITTLPWPLPRGRALVIDTEQALLPQPRFACQVRGCDPPLGPRPVSRTMPSSRVLRRDLTPV
jgi:hypothetical protein